MVVVTAQRELVGPQRELDRLWKKLGGSLRQLGGFQRQLGRLLRQLGGPQKQLGGFWRAKNETGLMLKGGNLRLQWADMRLH